MGIISSSSASGLRVGHGWWAPLGLGLGLGLGSGLGLPDIAWKQPGARDSPGLVLASGAEGLALYGQVLRVSIKALGFPVLPEVKTTTIGVLAWAEVWVTVRIIIK